MSAFPIRWLSNLSIAEKGMCAQVPDLLGREVELPLAVHEGGLLRVAVALEQERAVGWIRYFPQRLLLYRARQTGAERLLTAALIEFPVTERMAPACWKALVDHALVDLFQAGARSVGIYLPPECQHHGQFLAAIGFERHSECDRLGYLRAFGYVRTCTLWMRHCDASPSHQMPELYPYATEQAGILYTADAATAPDPTAAFWSEACLYSGYSGYPWFSDFLARFVDAGTRSLLSVPCATADVFRLLPAARLAELELGVGVDIIARNVGFGKSRLVHPQLDVINQFLCHVFFARQDETLEVEVPEVLRRIGQACGRELTPEEATECCRQLHSAFLEVAQGEAITDWFALTKGLGRFLALSPEPGIFVPPATGADGFEYCRFLTDRLGVKEMEALIEWLRFDRLFTATAASGEAAREAFEHGRIRLEAQDLFQMNLGERYQVIFVWEAALMIVGSGEEEPFLDQISTHLAPGGTLILTGIRGVPNCWPRELEILDRLLSKRGFRVSRIGACPRPAPWAFGHVPQVWFPVLVAQAP